MKETKVVIIFVIHLITNNGICDERLHNTPTYFAGKTFVKRNIWRAHLHKTTKT